MKKIVLSVAIIALSTTVIVGATRAYFSDTETSTGNTFAAGTLDLNLDGADTNSVKFTVTNTAPGASGTSYWTVKNVGSLAGYVDLASIAKTNDDNLCTEPESTDGDTTCGAGQGELGANMNITIFVDADKDGVIDGGETTLYTGTLDGLATSYDANLALAAGAEQYVSLNWSIPTTVGNVIQSDSVQLDMSFQLGQTI
ncbi:MAG TPA: TasA family protein [Candidatus Paceibacterota bacterium]|nr:TasA family protein [Candidatus Paceibacterota bacterium]